MNRERVHPSWVQDPLDFRPFTLHSNVLVCVEQIVTGRYISCVTSLYKTSCFLLGF